MTLHLQRNNMQNCLISVEIGTIIALNYYYFFMIINTKLCNLLLQHTQSTLTLQLPSEDIAAYGGKKKLKTLETLGLVELTTEECIECFGKG